MYVDIRTAAERMTDSTLENRGGTFDRDGNPVQPASGYAVAVQHLGTGNGALLSRDYLRDRLVEALIGNPTDTLIGTWVDTNPHGHDVAYVDRVVILPDRESALILAAAFRELAVWDFSTMSELRLDRKAA